MIGQSSQRGKQYLLLHGSNLHLHEAKSTIGIHRHKLMSIYESLRITHLLSFYYLNVPLFLNA